MIVQSKDLIGKVGDLDAYSPFLLPEWISITKSPKVLVDSLDDLSVYLPFKHGKNAKILSIEGGIFLEETSLDAFLGSGKKAADLVIKEINPCWLRISGLDHPELRKFGEVFSSSGWKVINSIGQPELFIGKVSFNEWLKLLPSRKRRFAKKALKYENVKIEENSALMHLNTLIDIEHSTWKKASGIFSEKRYRISLKLLEKFNHYVTLMEYNNKAVGCLITIVWRNKAYLWSIFSKPEVNKLSPGHILICHTIKHLLNQNIERIEFLGKPNIFKRHWALGEHPRTEYRIFKPNYAGKLCYLIEKLNLKLKKKNEQ